MILNMEDRIDIFKEMTEEQMESRERIAEFGNDEGTHGEAVYFIRDFGFVLSVWDIRIDTEHFRLSKEKFLEWMSEYYDDCKTYWEV